MRGDSLSDLYAKGLALFGLGLLAGIGALVDYWPTRGALPSVPSQPHVARVAATRPVPADWQRATAPATAERSARRSLVPAAIPSIAVSAPSSTFGQSVTSLAPPMPASPAPVAVLASATPALPSPHADLLILPPPATPVITAAWSTETDDGHSLFTGAVKRPVASIIRTSARAGASVFDAFRTLGGAMRRALPN